MDGTNALRETTTTHSLQLPNAKKSDKEEREGGRERERERETFLGEDFLLSRCFSLDKGRGDNKRIVVCFVRVFSTHQHGIFPITHGNHTERERERRRRRREHPCRGVSILCSTCGIVQLHSIVAPPSTTTGVVGLSNTSSLGGFQSRGRRRGRGEICVPLPSLCDQSVDILLQTLLFLDQPFRGQRAGDGESSVELRFCCWE